MGASSASRAATTAAQRPGEVRRALDALDLGAVGADMHAAVAQLYPIGRSITGEGVRSSLRLLQQWAPVELTEVPSGTAVLDWTVPLEWNVREAWVRGPSGEVIADFSRLNLHLVGYSAPFRGRLPLERLREHLHALPGQPSLVPYRTSYYREAWGFCISQAQLDRLQPGEYDVLVDTSFSQGSLTYGEVVVRGEVEDEVLVSAHCCHPSLCNDNLSGMVVATWLARILGRLALRHTYRLLFAPATIGAIAWLASNESRIAHIRHGIVVAGVGDGGPLTWKRSRRGGAEVDRAAHHVLQHCGEPSQIREFSPYGYDERQYCSPGFNLPVGCLSRSPFGEYPEYHTSGDDLSFVKPRSLALALRSLLAIVEVLEGNQTFVSTCPKGEPQLGRRGLYGSAGGGRQGALDQMALLWVLNLSDGKHTLLDVAERSGLAFSVVRTAADALAEAGLLESRGAST